MSPVKAREERPGLAVALMLVAFLCFVCMDTIAKWLVTREISSLQVAFVRYAGHFAVSLAIFVPLAGPRIFVSDAPKIQALRGSFLLFSTLCNFTAVYYLPLPVTISIIFASPLLVCLLSIPILGEKVGIRRFLAVIVGLVGVLIIVQPGSAEFHPAIFLSLGALLGASFYFVLTRTVAGRDDNSTSQLWSAGIPTLLLLPIGLAIWDWPATTLDGVLMILIGCLATLGHSLLTIAHRFAPASVLAPLVYVQIIYISIISWLIFDEPPTTTTLMGTAVIIASGLYIWLRERTVKPA